MTDILQGARLPADADIYGPHPPGAYQYQTLAWVETDDPAAACAGEDQGRARLVYRCPRTGAVCGGIVIGHGVRPPGPAPGWIWDGNVQAPTLTPAIQCAGGCGWHGHLTAGVWHGQ